MKRKRMGLFRPLLLAALSVAFGYSSSSFAQQADGKKEIRIPKKVTQMIVEQIVPAIRESNDELFLHLSMPLIKSSKPEKLAAIDRLCEENAVATVSDRFTSLVLEQTEQGKPPVGVTANLTMSKVVLYGIVEELEEFETSLAGRHVMEEPLKISADFQEGENQFWDIHVLRNEFETTNLTLRFASSLMGKHERSLRRQDEGQALAAQFTEISDRLQGKFNDVKERAAELRLQRFKSAHQTLVTEANKGNFELLLTAAMALEQDAHVLSEFLKGNQAISRAALQDPNLLSEVSSMLASGRKAGGDVVKKGNLLSEGLHYWVRGRYGSGPESNGLVKAQGAGNSIKTMERLLMPKVIDKPISNFLSDDETTPGYDRRHHYSWGAEYRPTSESESTEYKQTSSTASPWKNVGNMRESSYW